VLRCNIAKFAELFEIISHFEIYGSTN